jgi:uncharacterized protein
VRALVLSGEREFADPWHDLAATSGRLAQILERAGFRVQVRADVVDALAHRAAVDLIAVNCSGAASGVGSDSVLAAPAVAGLHRHLAAGRGVLAVHSAVMSFPDWPGWAELVGARWRAGASMHPPRGPARIRVHTGTHPIVEDVHDFETSDERYSRLERTGAFMTLAEHDHDGRTHPLVWARTYGPAQAGVVYDGLGHDLAGYDSPAHCELLARAARWAARQPPSAAP